MLSTFLVKVFLFRLLEGKIWEVTILTNYLEIIRDTIHLLQLFVKASVLIMVFFPLAKDIF